MLKFQWHNCRIEVMSNQRFQGEIIIPTFIRLFLKPHSSSCAALETFFLKIFFMLHKLLKKRNIIIISLQIFFPPITGTRAEFKEQLLATSGSL